MSDKALSAEQRRELFSFVQRYLRHPTSEHSKAMLDDIDVKDFRKLAASTRIQECDLNHDGAPEFILQGNGLGPCGGTGNCAVLVLRQSTEGVTLLFDSYAGKNGGGYEKIRVLETATNGFQDIVLASHISASERFLTVLRFSRGKYRPSECHWYRISEGKSSPEISERVKCD